jgi:hypothetical protein
MSSSEKDSFTNKFALHLALGLLGPSRVIEYLSHDERKERPAVPLYWRSKLMIPDASRILYYVGENVDTTMSKTSPPTKTLFFDVTFNFVKKVHHRGEEDNKSHLLSTQKPTSSCHVLVSLGFFLLLQKGFEAPSEDRTDTEFGGGHYISTQALDYQQIMSHSHSLQLEPESVDPEALASSMAAEFLRQGSPSSITAREEKGQNLKIRQRIQEESYALTANYVNIKNTRKGIEKEENGEVKNKTSPTQSQSFDDFSTDCDICVNIPYKSMGNSSGRLLLKCSPSGVTTFDRSALRFLSWDFSKNPNHFENLPKNSESLLSKKDLVDDAFNRWRIQAKRNGSNTCNDDSNHGKQKLESSNTHVALTTTVDSNGTRTDDKHKRRRAFKGMGILPSARHKRNKGLVYDTK